MNSRGSKQSAIEADGDYDDFFDEKLHGAAPD